MLVALSFGLAGARLARRILPPLLPTIIVDLSISPFQAGIALSLTSLGFALLQFPSGRLSDQLSRKSVLVPSLAIGAFGSVLLWQTSSYLALLIGAAIVGIGEGLYGVADRGLLSDLFVQRRGIAFGVHTTFSDVGGILAAGLAAGALAIGAWQTAFLPAIFGLALISLLHYRWGDEPIVIKKVSPQIRETVGRLFGHRRFQVVLLAYALFSFTVQGVIGFLPTLLKADHGFSSELATAAFAGMFATGIAARPLAGRISDWGSRLVVAGTGLTLGGLGLLILVFSRSPVIAMTGVVVFAIGQKAYPPTMQAYLMDSFPDGSMGGDLGATRTFYLSVGSLGPTYVGYVGGVYSYTVAFAGFVGAFLLSGLLVLSLAHTE